jgi:anti-sigma regulatory factor (Ser/Thr protein kinase)
VNDRALRDFIPTLYDALSSGHSEMVLDFRRSERAYADAILPIICLIDHRRSRGNEFRILLPESPTLRQLFLNANWAHHLDPSHPRLDLETRQHLAAQRYATPTEQHRAVNSVMDVVLRNIELKREVLKALEWSVNEITDNVLTHAESATGGLVQISTFRDECKIKFVVADAGRGIPSAMRDAFPRIADAEALSEAIKPGVTSGPGQGNGLTGSLRIATGASGSFKVTSGKASLSVFREGRGDRYRTQKTRAPEGFKFPGTVVMVELATDADLDLMEALTFGDMPAVDLVDVVDVRYVRGTDELQILVRDEAVGFGSRHAGAELRRKLQNLLAAEPTRTLVLDWNGVPLVSSSFADEVVGKLFVELGPSAFTARVKQLGQEPLVRSLVDRAIMQRVVQVMKNRDEPDPLQPR